MSDKKNGLFSEFDPPSKKDWIDKATIDLKGGDFHKRLVWKNLNDIEVQPFYTREDRKETLTNSGKNLDTVTNYRRIHRDTENKNELAHLAISEGMTGLLFEVGASDKVANLLEGIDIARCAVSFSLDEENSNFVAELLSYFKKSKMSRELIKGFLEVPFLDQYLTQGILENKTVKFLADWTQRFNSFENFKTLFISGSTYVNAGANQVQEIAFTLNSVAFVAEELKNRGLKDELIFNNFYFSLGISSEYFIEIAKLRSFSSLFHLIAGKYGVSDPNMALMSRTSIWSKSVTDANTNMLRATTETMSALLGNSHAIEIDPYDTELGISEDFSKRIAGNIATILKEESYFGKVGNPVDGSYYIEELTHELAEKALDLFKEVESLGGFYKAVEQQVIQNKIALVRLTRIKLLSQRRTAMVGVNKYPNLMETVPEKTLCHKVPDSDPKLLVPRRAGLELELIRANTEEFVNQRGDRPVVEFASFGNLGMRKARAGFAFDFLGIAGYAMEEEKSYDSALSAAEKSASSKSDIVVMCSSDDDYKTSALEFINTFRSLNHTKILVLAGFPAEILEELTAAGLDTCIHVRSDIFNTLNEINQKLTRTTKKLEI